MAANDLRLLARSLFDTGIRAADPTLAVKEALASKPLPELRDGHHYLIAVGKAACGMMEAAMRCLPKDAKFIAIAVTNYENVRDIPDCTVIGAAHPIPDQNGLDAGRKVRQLLADNRPNDHVLCLISGGGSALLPAPVPGLTLDDKIKVNELMLAHGLDITQTNLVRQQLSSLKGGGMARLAAPASVRTLAVSDVIGDDPRVIASGPTASSIGSVNDAIKILESFGIWDELPRNTQTILRQAKNQDELRQEESDIEIICSNRQSLCAIATAAPERSPQVISGELTGDVQIAAREIIDAMRSAPLDRKQLLIWGGETTVRIQGDGLGGRNQELALRVAMGATDVPGDWVFLAGGTDGRDGPTDAAGGIVDKGTVSRINAAGLNPNDLLLNNDSYHALKAAGDHLIVGATGTNVADVAIFLRQ